MRARSAERAFSCPLLASVLAPERRIGSSPPPGRTLATIRPLASSARVPPLPSFAGDLG